MKKLLLLLLLVATQMNLVAQEMPQWVLQKPRPANDSYLYVVERGVGATEMEARNRAMGLVYRSTIERLALAIDLSSINEAIANGSNYGESSDAMHPSPRPTAVLTLRIISIKAAYYEKKIDGWGKI